MKILVQTDFDFAILFNDCLYDDFDFTIEFESLSDLDDMKVLGPFGSKPQYHFGEWEEALARIRANPDESFDTTSGNRGVTWLGVSTLAASRLKAYSDATAKYHEEAIFRASRGPDKLDGQKFARGQRVRVNWAQLNRNATVIYSHAQAYGDDKVDSYCLNIDREGKSSWYPENVLTEIKDEKVVTFDMTLFDDQSTKEKLTVMDAIEAMFDDCRNVVPDSYYEIVDLKPGQTLRATFEVID